MAEHVASLEDTKLGQESCTFLSRGTFLTVCSPSDGRHGETLRVRETSAHIARGSDSSHVSQHKQLPHRTRRPVAAKCAEYLARGTRPQLSRHLQDAQPQQPNGSSLAILGVFSRMVLLPERRGKDAPDRPRVPFVSSHERWCCRTCEGCARRLPRRTQEKGRIVQWLDALYEVSSLTDF